MPTTAARLARNSGLHFINMLLRALFAVLLSVLTARSLGAQGFGSYQFLVWLIGLGVLAVNLGLPTTVTRYVAEFEGRGDRAGSAALLRDALRLRLLLGVGVALVMALGAGTLVERLRLELPPGWLALAGLVVLCEALFGIIDAAIGGLQRYHYTTLLVTLRGLSELLLTWLVLWPLRWGVPGLLLVNAAELLLLLLVAAYLLRRELAWGTPTRQDAATRQRVLRFGSSLALITVLNAVIWDKSEIFFLQLYATAEEVGAYGLAFGWAGRLFGLLPGVLAGVLLPVMAQLYGADDTEGLRRTYTLALRCLALLALPLGALGCLLARPLLLLLYGEPFAGAVLPLQILLASGALVQLSFASGALMTGAERQRALLWSSLAVGVLNLLLDLLLIPTRGAVGAALANGISQLLGALLGALYIVLRMRYQLPWSALARTAAAAALAALPVLALRAASNTPALLLAAGPALFVPVYAGALLLLGALTRAELAALGRFGGSGFRVRGLGVGSRESGDRPA